MRWKEDVPFNRTFGVGMLVLLVLGWFPIKALFEIDLKFKAEKTKKTNNENDISRQPPRRLRDLLRPSSGRFASYGVTQRRARAGVSASAAVGTTPGIQRSSGPGMYLNMNCP